MNLVKGEKFKSREELFEWVRLRKPYFFSDHEDPYEYDPTSSKNECYYGNDDFHDGYYRAIPEPEKSKLYAFKQRDGIILHSIREELPMDGYSRAPEFDLEFE
jgi:hypothetical protein